jgi:hypothetical protein
MNTQKNISKTTISTIFIMVALAVGMSFWVVGNNYSGREIAVWPEVDTSVGPLDDLCPTNPGFIDAPLPEPAGFPFSYEVYDAVQCKTGTNYLAVILNILIVLMTALPVTVVVAKVLKGSKHK